MNETTPLHIMGLVGLESSIEVLVRFARLASEARGGAKILPQLVQALVDHAKADAVAVFEIGEGGAAFVPSPHLPQELEALTIDPDAIGEEMGTRLLAACKGSFSHVRSHPLVSGGGLFGSVILFFRSKPPLEESHLAEGLVDLAAIGLANAVQLLKLARSHADLRASQETLARTEKLRALGQMAAGVSHDLRNILNPISLHLQLLMHSIERGNADEARETAAAMKLVLVRGVQSIERLREYSRQSPTSHHENIDLNHLMREAVEIARPRMATRGVRMNRVRTEPGEPPVFSGRPGEIMSALVNLIVNAIDAVCDGGSVIVRTGSANGGAWVQVVDDGPGIPNAVVQRVFEPFFSTKGDEGTGLGLAMVDACARRHGGTVKLETSPGCGTTFTLWFPGEG